MHPVARVSRFRTFHSECYGTAVFNPRGVINAHILKFTRQNQERTKTSFFFSLLFSFFHPVIHSFFPFLFLSFFFYYFCLSFFVSNGIVSLVFFFLTFFCSFLPAFCPSLSFFYSLSKGANASACVITC